MRVLSAKNLGTLLLGVCLILMFAGAMSFWSLAWAYS
jgi:hypothetical protein